MDTGRVLRVLARGRRQGAPVRRVEVPTLDGRASVTLPPGTRSGQKLRLKGRGVAASGSRAAGDLYAIIQIVPPKAVDARSRELLEEFERRNPGA